MDNKSGLALLQCYSDSDEEMSDRTEVITEKPISTVMETNPSVESLSTDLGRNLPEFVPSPKETFKENFTTIDNSKQESSNSGEPLCPGMEAEVADSNIQQKEQSESLKNLTIQPSSDHLSPGTEAEIADSNIQQKEQSESLKNLTIQLSSDHLSPGTEAEIVDSNIQQEEESESFQNLTVQPSSEIDSLNFRHPYRQAPSSDSDSDSSSDESVGLSSITSIPVVDIADEFDEDCDPKAHDGQKNSKMFEDLGLLDLPPLEDLKITVPEEECIPIGTISKIVDLLVIVQAKKGTPAVDLDSVLFLDHGKKTLGRVFDVFGQVHEPMYMVRFNSGEQVAEQGIVLDMEVYFAPRTPHTAFVFIDNLIKMKGSDASWLDDAEPPEGCLDYSDDEQERQAKAARKMKRALARESATGEPTEPMQPNPRQRSRPNHPRGRGRGRGRGNYHQNQNPFYIRQPDRGGYHQPAPNMWVHQAPPPPPPAEHQPPHGYPEFGGPPEFPPSQP